MRLKYIRLFSLLILLLYNCKEREQKENSNNEEILIQDGFIIKTEKDEIGDREWYFVPTKEINIKSWLNDFRTDNLKNGFEFFPMGHKDFPIDYIEKHLDTLHLPNNSGDRFYTSKLMLFPVRVKYKLRPEFRNKQTRLEFIQSTGDREVRFGFNSLPVNIQDMVPLAKPKWKLAECKCEPKEGDIDRYLIKICHYLKKRESKFSDTPCSYSIEKVEFDTLESQKVIKVSLNCCYLGDVAYFDPVTKEIIKFEYGAM